MAVLAPARRRAPCAHGGLTPLVGHQRSNTALPTAWKQLRRERNREGLRVEYGEARQTFLEEIGLARGSKEGVDVWNKDTPRETGRDPYAKLETPLLLGDVCVVLTSPKIPSNVGAVARLINSFEGHELRLVKPRCCHTQRGAKRGAAGALDVLCGAKLYDDFASAIEGLRTVSYTRWTSDQDAAAMPLVSSLSALRREDDWEGLDATPAGEEKLPDTKLGLIFGREDAGLFTNEESLSMPTTVAIALAELFQLRQERAAEGR